MMIVVGPEYLKEKYGFEAMLGLVYFATYETRSGRLAHSEKKILTDQRRSRTSSAKPRKI